MRLGRLAAKSRGHLAAIAPARVAAMRPAAATDRVVGQDLEARAARRKVVPLVGRVPLVAEAESRQQATGSLQVTRLVHGGYRVTSGLAT